MDFMYLQEHLHELVDYMRKHDYFQPYINRYRTTISQIVSNAVDHSWGSYNDIYLWYESQSYADSYLREIRAILGKLELFHLHGKYPDGKSSMSSFWKERAAYYNLTSEYQGMVDFYSQTERKRGLKETTIYSYAHKSASFLLALQNKGADSLGKITEEGVLSCFFENGKKIRSVSCKIAIAAFFRVCTQLYETECQMIIKYLPTLRATRKNIQYLSKEECKVIRMTLDDHDNGLYYKDRAIGMLLMYTGIRGGDIANLRLSSFDLAREKIYLKQQKTEKPKEFQLSAIVGNAIYDYCVHERPGVDEPHLFLSCKAPHGSLTTDGIAKAVERILEKSDIRQHSGARKGTHIFRHHLATTLLEKGIPKPVISSALGHDAPISLESYLYADMVHLKECALSVEQYAILEEVFVND